MRPARSGLAVLLPVAGVARGGDEVDYSAPYITVEDGELVTRYPAKAHESVPQEEVAPRAEGAPVFPTLSVLAALLVFAIAAVLLRRAVAGRKPHD